MYNLTLTYHAGSNQKQKPVDIFQALVKNKFHAQTKVGGGGATWIEVQVIYTLVEKVAISKDLGDKV